MPRKNRGYKRDEPHRDARFFVIVCEGAKTEKEYFDFFDRLTQRLKFRILPPENDASAPRYSLSRAIEYEEDFGLTNRDQLWFVLDVYRWGEALRRMNEECNKHTNWHLAISNPCFEVWLLMHFRDVTKKDTNGTACEPFKKALRRQPDGYKAEKAAFRIEEAIQRAKTSDADPDHFMPNLPGTKLYQLAEQMLEYMGQEWERVKQSGKES